MKENLHQGESGKKWRAKKAKFIRLIKRGIVKFLEAYALKQGLSRGIYRKINRAKKRGEQK